MRAVFILADSVNRRFLNAYGAAEKAVTPNLDRLAERSVVFENHWCGSSPCMPARRDILTGRLNFLERPWGGIEPFDQVLPSLLSEQNVYTHMETDHFHYTEIGGENYWGHFTSWNLHRGVEHDTVNWGPDKTGIPHPERPEGFCGLYSPSYEVTKSLYGGNPEKYSTPRTYNTAAQWLEKNHDADNFLLWVEGFDPHEPFDVPKEYMDLYEDDHFENSEQTYWPRYERSDGYTPEEIAHLRRRYKALLSMTDHYIGKLLDVLDQNDMWKDTMVIFTTDHGFMLGEHGFFAKCYMPDYNEVFHIPLMISMPGIKPGRCGALTQNIDMFPTFLELFGVPESRCVNPIHGKSLLPLLRGEVEKLREAVLYGVFGKTVNVTDGRYTYLKKPVTEDNQPLTIYASVMALLNKYIGLDSVKPEDFRKIRMGKGLCWTDYPVYEVPTEIIDWGNYCLDFRILHRFVEEDMLFDLQNDYEQNHNIHDEALKEKMSVLMRQAMLDCQSPDEQFVRMGV